MAKVSIFCYHFGSLYGAMGRYYVKPHPEISYTYVPTTVIDPHTTHVLENELDQLRVDAAILVDEADNIEVDVPFDFAPPLDMVTDQLELVSAVNIYRFRNNQFALQLNQVRTIKENARVCRAGRHTLSSLMRDHIVRTPECNTDYPMAVTDIASIYELHEVPEFPWILPQVGDAFTTRQEEWVLRTEEQDALLADLYLIDPQTTSREVLPSRAWRLANPNCSIGRASEGLNAIRKDNNYLYIRRCRLSLLREAQSFATTNGQQLNDVEEYNIKSVREFHECH